MLKQMIQLFANKYEFLKIISLIGAGLFMLLSFVVYLGLDVKEAREWIEESNKTRKNKDNIEIIKLEKSWEGR